MSAGQRDVMRIGLLVGLLGASPRDHPALPQPEQDPVRALDLDVVDEPGDGHVSAGPAIAAVLTVADRASEVSTFDDDDCRLLRVDQGLDRRRDQRR